MNTPPRLSLASCLTAAIPALALFVASYTPAASAPPVVSTASLLADMTDADRLARLPEQPYRALLASSYDRSSTASDKPGWFANGDYSNFIRKETVDGHTEYVMM